MCEGEESKQLWDEVYEYIENTYDLSKIYWNEDGGSWITTGKRRIAEGISQNHTEQTEENIGGKNQGIKRKNEFCQRKRRIKVVGSEEVIYSSSKMWIEEWKRQKELGYLADIPGYSISYAQIKKMLNFKHQIFGL